LVLGVKPEEGINDFCSRSGAPRRVLTAFEAGLGFIKKYDFSLVSGFCIIPQLTSDLVHYTTKQGNKEYYDQIGLFN